MTTLRQAAQQALEAMEGELPDWRTPAQAKAITALRDALAQEEQEPVAWMSRGKERLEFSRPDTVYGSHTIPLFPHPPRREWRSLTDDEISALFSSSLRSDYKPYSFARAIEAKLKERNA